MKSRTRSQGAELTGDAVHFRIWAPGRKSVEAVILDRHATPIRTVPLQAECNGYFSAEDPLARPGHLYKYRINQAETWPDPVSRWQPFGVHGPSAIIDPADFSWTDTAWSPPQLHDLIIYELHVGTLTPEGTFRAAIEKLDHISRLGATAIEIMPVADFPGQRNWGYDGVMLYAPAHVYGPPNDLRALVDAAHARGLAVILDVVYNHLGPDGNYLGVYSEDYRDHSHQTPWGASFNLQLPAVRQLFVENPPYWMREFHIDGFRLDATHEIYDASPKHLLREIGESIHALGGFATAEDDRNSVALLTPLELGGMGLGACWADDFHHVVRVVLTGEQDGYFADYRGTGTELVETLRRGWLYSGQERTTSGKRRGEDPVALPPEKFIYCISNHDQVGNRAFGERLNHAVSPAAFRAASTLLCLVPYTPLLFMGQEWAAGTPFRYFTDHNDELGPKITRGRRQEFRDFKAFHTPELLNTIPDPQDDRTFLESKLDWSEIDRPQHAQTLLLYGEALHLRRSLPALRRRARGQWQIHTLENETIALIYGGGSAECCAIVFNLIGGKSTPALEAAAPGLPGGGNWEIIFSSNEERFGGDGAITFDQPITLVLASK